MSTVISVEGLSKAYRLGQIGRGTLSSDISRWWARARGRPDPFLRIGGAEARISPGEMIWALRDVNFSVQGGDILGIIGRNGAGKSTLLKVLSRITSPTHGRVRVKGKVASLLEIGTGFHPELTGRENTFLNGSILGMSSNEVAKKLDAIVDFAEIAAFLDTPVKRYSSGMYVRLAFAVAAHLDPEILVVDEVLAVGDANFQAKCLGRMGAVAREGRTVLFVSHNMTALQSLCERALWLDGGSTRAEGAAAVVVSKYLRSSQDGVLERSWSQELAPGDDRVRLVSVRLLRAGADPEEPLTVETGFLLEVSYKVLEVSADLNVSVVIYNQQGICVLNTASQPSKMRPGVATSLCEFPANLLNDGSYQVRLLLVRDGSTPILDLDDVLAFDIADVNRPKGWFGKWVGVVRPALRWETTQAGAQGETSS